VKIALLQMDAAWEAPGQNRVAAASLLAEAAAQRCDAAVLPEMFSTGFSIDVSALESEDGPTSEFLAREARRLGLNIVAGFKAKAPEGPANLAHVYGRDGTRLSRYLKMRPFSLAGEDGFFISGKLPVEFSLDGVPSSVFICYDLRFPELFRQVARKARVVFVIANWPDSRGGHWTALLKARAIENQCFVVGVNRTGRDGMGIMYSGGSSVYGPLGQEICAMGDEPLAACEIEPGEAEAVREKFPFLKDIR